MWIIILTVFNVIGWIQIYYQFKNFGSNKSYYHGAIALLCFVIALLTLNK